MQRILHLVIFLLLQELFLQLPILHLQLLHNGQQLLIGVGLLLPYLLLRVHISLQQNRVILLTLFRQNRLKCCNFCPKAFHLTEINLLRIKQRLRFLFIFNI